MLAFFPSQNLLIWTDGFVPFIFGKSGSGVLANCLLCGAEATSYILSSLLLNWKCTVLSKFFDMLVPLMSTKGLVLPHHTHCVLFGVCCNRPSLLIFYLSRVGRIEDPSCSVSGHLVQDNSYLFLPCPATDSVPLTLWESFYLCNFWSRP